MRREAFSLIELLVVVAIIAVLVAVLLPALTSAREAAQGAGCLANLKQLDMGFRYYAEDYGGFLPTANEKLAEKSYWTWDRALGRYMASHMRYTYPGEVPHSEDTRSVFVCPGETVKRMPAGSNPASGITRSYSRVVWKLSPTWVWTYETNIWVQIRRFEDPTRQFLVAEWRWSGNVRGVNWPGAWINRNYWELGEDPENPYSTGVYAAPRDGHYHGEGANYLFMDGHASHLGPNEGGESIYWDYP